MANDRNRNEERGLVGRAGDELRSWFGNGAEQGGGETGQDRDSHQQSRHADPHYHDWRERQIAELDRDYDEYRRERQQQFHQDFSTWRSNRQTERGSGASTRAAESVRPSDMAGGNAGRPTSPAAAGTDYAGEPGPAGIKGENHMDPVRVDENADPAKA